MKYTFASDNCAGVDKRIMKAMEEVNEDFVLSYGDDKYTEAALKAFKDEFGADTKVYFVYNGTGANTISLGSILKKYQAVITPEFSHISVDETGAPERYTGCKLITCPTEDGKLRIGDIAPHLDILGVVHHSQPKVVSITNPTEEGTLYTTEEIKEICDFAHENGLYVHLDGARIGNAAAALQKSLKEITKDCGVDVLSFGGTKGGMMFGEAVVFFNKDLGEDFAYYRKNGTQLHSKMRFISAQFETYLKNKIYLENGQHANDMCKYFYGKLKNIDGIEFVYEPQVNGMFLKMAKEMADRVLKEYFFYDMDTKAGKVLRLMCSFATQKEDIDNFISILEQK
ncbi:MAG: aminotransferase class V-fold PLP-dependent enzyme [Eubacteriales bacterium]